MERHGIMKGYLRERARVERDSTLAGIILTVLVLVPSGLALSNAGLKYLDPPPPETTFVVDFSEEEEEAPRPPRVGRQPRSSEVDKSRPIELVQESRSKQVSERQNLTPATRQDDFGDVETEKVEVEDALDPRAAFPGMGSKDTTITAPHAASESSDSYKAGQPEGNTTKGRADGAPNAHLKGRKTVGTIPRPAYKVQESGTVVMDIRVDKSGKVVSAVVGDGTTTYNKELVNAARKAAMETHFNTDGKAPALQEGTITYIFKLN